MLRNEIIEKYRQIRRATTSDKKAVAEFLSAPFVLPVDATADDVVDFPPDYASDLLLAAATGAVEIADRDDAERVLRRIVGATRKAGRPRASEKLIVEVPVPRDVFDALTEAAKATSVSRAQFCRDAFEAAIKKTKKNN